MKSYEFSLSNEIGFVSIQQKPILTLICLVDGVQIISFPFTILCVAKNILDGIKEDISKLKEEVEAVSKRVESLLAAKNYREMAVLSARIEPLVMYNICPL